jgi:hypothetical protein
MSKNGSLGAEATAGLIMLLLIILWWGSLVGLSFYGAFVAFSTSIILGLCFFLFPPLFLLSGALKLFFHYNLPEKILDLLK